MNYMGLVNTFNRILIRTNPVTRVSMPLTLVGDLQQVYLLSEASLSFIALWVVFSYRTYTPFTWISKAGPSQPGPSEIKEGVENLNNTQRPG